MSQQAAWDTLVNTRVAQIDSAITRLDTEKAVVDARLANLSGGANEDVAALRTELTNQSSRLGNRSSNQGLAKTSAQARLYASLPVSQKAIVDKVCGNCSLHVQTMLAHSAVDPDTVDSRVAAGKGSVTTPDNITSEDTDKLWGQVIQRMEQGL